MGVAAYQKPNPPASVTDGRAIFIAGLALSITLMGCRLSDASVVLTVFALLGAWAVPIALYDLIVGQVYRRESTGLDPALLWVRSPDLPRLAVKSLGILVTLIVVGAFWAAMALSFPQLFRPFLLMSVPAAPTIIIIILLYVVIVDGMMRVPQDTLYEVGALGLLRWSGRDWHAIREYFLAWVIKGYFLPLMFGYLINRAANVLLSVPLAGGMGLFPVVLWLISVGVLFDLIVAVSGYTLTLRPLDNHIRSTNPSPLGWFVCMICYAPISAMTLWILFKYNDGHIWADWFADRLWLAVFWALAILFFQACWVWTNLMFGLRFSNLTHRGIITNGPFRFTKHPSYISKNLSWWLIHVPFLSAVGWEQALFHCVGLFGVNVVYVFRAKTEERHLMNDPIYRAYAGWVAEHGVLAVIARRMSPLLPRRTAAM